MNKLNPIEILNGKIPFPSLLSELLEYGKNMNSKLFERKVFRIWMKCKKAKKYELADKIKNKYTNCFNIKSDSAIAFALALNASNKLKNE